MIDYLNTLIGPAAPRNLVLAAVVGSILNIINQGDVLVALSGVNWWRFGLNFVVPFLVSSYGSWNMARLARRPVRSRA